VLRSASKLKACANILENKLDRYCNNNTEEDNVDFEREGAAHMIVSYYNKKGS
jgi:uncharacterized protein YkuJ